MMKPSTQIRLLIGLLISIVALVLAVNILLAGTKGLLIWGIFVGAFVGFWLFLIWRVKRGGTTA